MSRLLAIGIIAMLACGCAQPESAAPRPKAARSVIEALPSPAPAGAAEPFLATARDGVLLSWLEPIANSDRTALRFARYANGQWSEPRTIVERNDLFVNWADFPSIVEDANGALYAHWLQKSGSGTYAYDVRMLTSVDGGKMWGPPFVLNRDGKKTEHGFATLAALPNGGIGATWLDGRNMSENAHEGHDAGDMTIRYATIDAKGTIANDVELDGRTCECCTTGMAITANGPLIAYRDRSGEEIRDISYVRAEGGAFTQPQPVHVDGWKINGCPVNGPQVDAIGNRTVVAWFTAANDKQRVYAAFSEDGGKTFAKPVVVDDGKPVGRVDVVLLEDGSAVVSWLEQTAAGGEVRARRVPRNGSPAPSIKVAESATARAAGFTRIAKVGEDVWFTWTAQDATKKQIHVARANF